MLGWLPCTLQKGKTASLWQCAPVRLSGKVKWVGRAWKGGVLASGPVVADVLLQGVQFLRQAIDAPLQQVPDGEDAEEFAVVVGDRQMTEMALDHGSHGFARPGFLRGHFNRRGHQVTHGSGFRVQIGQGEFAQDIALGEDAGDSAFLVYDTNGTDMVVEHPTDGIGHAGFDGYGGGDRITKLQQVHRDLRGPSLGVERLVHYEPRAAGVKRERQSPVVSGEWSARTVVRKS